MRDMDVMSSTVDGVLSEVSPQLEMDVARCESPPTSSYHGRGRCMYMDGDACAEGQTWASQTLVRGHAVGIIARFSMSC